MDSRFLFTFELTPGMISAEDVYSVAGHLIIPKNSVLDSEMIKLLRMNSVTDIKISNVADRATGATYAERLVQSEHFQNFKVDFTGSINTFKDSINDVVFKNQPLDTEHLISKCSSLLDKTGPSLDIFSMLNSMKEFSDSTYTHSINVALIAAMLGRWLNFSEKDLDTLMLCGMLHDIGKLLVPDEILNKPDRLTPEEYAIIKKHTVEGYNLLKDRELETSVKEAALLHHERCDGKGYPFGLTSDKIPNFAKIISIADVYDAMTAKRCYHEPMCPFKVINSLEEEAYAKYDPRYITPFLENVVNSYINNSVQLTDGRVGEIIMTNRSAYSKPLVRCENDFIDLAKTPELKIDKII